MKLVDLLDSKSCGSNPVSVRFRPAPPTFKSNFSFNVNFKLKLITLTTGLLASLLLSFFLLVAPSKALAVKLITSYQDGVPLKFNLENPEKLGLCAELLVLITEIEPSLKFEYTQKATTLARIESDFKSHKIDIYPCLIYNERRQSFLKFSDYDLFTTQHLVVGKKANINRLKNYEDLKLHSLKSSVLVLNGSTLVKTLESKKVMVDDKSSTVDGILKMLVSERAEYYYEQNLNLGRVLERPEYKDILVASSGPWNKNTLRFAYSETLDKKTVTKIENAIKVLIESGRIKTLYNKYAHTK